MSQEERPMAPEPSSKNEFPIIIPETTKKNLVNNTKRAIEIMESGQKPDLTLVLLESAKLPWLATKTAIINSHRQGITLPAEMEVLIGQDFFDRYCKRHRLDSEGQEINNHLQSFEKWLERDKRARKVIAQIAEKLKVIPNIDQAARVLIVDDCKRTGNTEKTAKALLALAGREAGRSVNCEFLFLIQSPDWADELLKSSFPHILSEEQRQTDWGKFTLFQIMLGRLVKGKSIKAVEKYAEEFLLGYGRGDINAQGELERHLTPQQISNVGQEAKNAFERLGVEIAKGL